MPIRRLRNVTDTLRYRIERALDMGALKTGDRLPSTREIADELKVNARVVSSAYRILEEEGLVEVRRRSGNYVSRRNLITSTTPAPPTSVVVDLFADAVNRGYSTREFSDYLTDAAFGSRLRAAIITGTSDQAEGIAAELKRDFSVGSVIIPPRTLKGGALPSELRKVHLIIATEAFAGPARRAAEKLDRPLVIITVRNNIMNDEWSALMARGVNVIAAEKDFLEILREYLKPSPQARRVKMFVAGVDSLESIKPEDPSYVTAAARKKLGTTRIPGHVIPPPRFLSDACVRAILSIVVAHRFGRELPPVQ